MHKFLYILLLLSSAWTLSAAVTLDASRDATLEIYDFSGFGDKIILDLFYNALQDGRNYPTDAEFEAVGIHASDLAFLRSHVRRSPILSRSNRLLVKTNENRNLWMNIPTDVGNDGKAGFPSGKFGADVYSMWNYTHLFGSWNHSFFMVPGCWVDAAHRNGTDILSGIKFFESWTPGGGDEAYVAMITEKNPDGTFKYVRPLINALMFFGSDGINYNWEDERYSLPECTAFHKALYREAASLGFDNFHAGIYTSASTLTTRNANTLFGNAEGRTFDLMLNYYNGDVSAQPEHRAPAATQWTPEDYSNGDFTSSYSMKVSVESAKAAMGTTEGLYAGAWMLIMDRSWNNLSDNPEIGVCLWGEHSQSRFYSYNKGTDAFDTQRNYQQLLERGFSGGKRNPASRPLVTSVGSGTVLWETSSDGEPPLSEFCGLAEFIPERTALQGDLHFQTHFTLGNGDRYYYKGKQSQGGYWYNMGAQDVVPTYRWLIYRSNTRTPSTLVQASYTHLDAYTGGSSIELTGKAASVGVDVVMYKGALQVAGTKAYAKVALKSGLETSAPSYLYLIVKLQGQTVWKEYAVGNTEGPSWEEKTLPLDDLAAGDVVEYIGFRVRGNNSAYKMLLGKLELNCDSYETPANVCALRAEVKDETQSSLSLKLTWEVEASAAMREAWNLLYNDEAHIHHFEVLYKNGINGRVAEVGRTSSWATFVHDIRFDDATDQPYIGVRSVSIDLQTYSPVVWLKVNRSSMDSLPEDSDRDSEGTNEITPSMPRDAGQVEEPELLVNADTRISELQADVASTVTVSAGFLHFSHVEKAWMYRSDGSFVCYIPSCSADFSIQGLAHGVYLIKMENHQVMRSQKVVL